jgi:hypothetical protein
MAGHLMSIDHYFSHYSALNRLIQMSYWMLLLCLCNGREQSFTDVLMPTTLDIKVTQHHALHMFPFNFVFWRSDMDGYT